MSLSINVSLSQKARLDSNATIYSINITADLDESLLTRPKELHERIAAIYAQAARSIDQQANTPPVAPSPMTADPAGLRRESTPPDRMNRERAAKYIGVKPNTLATWAMTGRNAVPFTRVGRRAVYSRVDLDRWMAERTGTSAGSIMAKLANPRQRRSRHPEIQRP
jgi:hypothetical protein